MQGEDAVLEVCLTDASGQEYIYWVKLKDLPQDEDEYDWAISISRAFHVEQGLPPIPEDAWSDDEDLMESAFASEPFEREAGEYTWVN